MGIFKSIKDWKTTWDRDSKPVKHHVLEVLEPRILLSGDSLLNVAAPEPLHDPLLDGMEQVVQYPELLETNEQVEEQVPSDTPDTDVYKPVFTLFVDDDNTNDKSVDVDLGFDNIGPAQVNSAIAVLSNDSDGDTESRVGTTEDDSPPICVEDVEISIEETTPIEIRGPPSGEIVLDNTISSCLESERPEVDAATIDEYAAEVQPDGILDLPGMYLVDPSVDYFDGQIVYLDFDGEEDVTYNGPVVVEGIDIPEFSAESAGLAGQEQEIISQILTDLEQQFEGTGVLFTITKPHPGTSYSTIFVGGDGAEFREYGFFVGVAEKIDVGNQERSDNAFVFSENVVGDYTDLGSFVTVLADAIAHETGHLLGFVHNKGHEASDLFGPLALGVDELPTSISLPPSSYSQIRIHRDGDITYSSSLSHGDELDYRVLRPDTGGTFTFETTGSTDTVMGLYNSSGSKLDDDDDGGSGTNSRISYSLSAGSVYWIVVTGYGSSSGSYSFKTTGPNQSLANTISTPGPSFTGSGTGSISPQYDIDFWGITAPSGTNSVNVSLDVQSSGLNGWLRLETSSGSTLGTANNGGNGADESLTGISVTAGQTYYITVTGWSATTGNYRLNVDFDPDQADADLALQNLVVSPLTVTDRKFTGCSFNIINNGPSALSSEPIMVDYYLSDDTTFGDADDRKIGDTGFTLSIASGGTYPITLSPTGLNYMVDEWTESLVSAGNYYVFAEARLTSPPPTDPVSSNNYDRTNSTITYDPATGEIHGFKWHDLDGDGAWDTDEPGLSGWIIQLDHGGDGTWDEFTTTGADGSYVFTNLPAGTYVVGEVLQNGWKQTSPVASGSATLASNMVGFGIGGTTIHSSMLNETLGVDLSANLLFDNCVFDDFVLHGTQWPQPGGLGTPVTITYSYSNLLDGNLPGGLTVADLWSAMEEALALWATFAPLVLVEMPDSGPMPPSDTGYSPDSHPDIRIGHHYIDGSSGQNTLAHAYYPGSTGLAGDVHFDNGNTWSTVPGISIDILEVGVHELGHSFGLEHEPMPTNGGNDAIMNPMYGSRYSGLGTAFLLPDDIAGIQAIYGEIASLPGTWTVHLDPSDIITDINFGNFELGSISGYKFEDINGNGADDAEPRLSNWTVELYLDNGDGIFNETTPTATKVTSSPDGAYSFTDLEVGDYWVREVLQAGWIQTTADPSLIAIQSGDNITEADYPGLAFGNFEFGGIIHVDDDATAGANNGLNWDDAFIYLQDALDFADSSGGQVSEIWVAQGIYKPDQGAAVVSGDRNASFQLLNGVAVIGGYAGLGVPDPNARDVVLYETILSGDLNSDDGPNFVNYGENSYHVVKGSGTDATAILDGFTIESGNANGIGAFLDDSGGGMYNSSGNPTIIDSTFSGNFAMRGGGMLNYISNPTLTNCTFNGNFAVLYGGGMANYLGSSPTLIESTFSSNFTLYYGGGMHNHLISSPVLTDCAFNGNYAGEFGGGISNFQYSNPKLANTTFSGNIAKYGGGMANYIGSAPTLINSTFSGNFAIYFGGGMHNQTDSSPVLINCIFNGNFANNFGGGMSNFQNSSPTLMNSTFSGNSAKLGGGMFNYLSSNPTLTNSTFSGNFAAFYGGGMFNIGSNPTITNSILWLNEDSGGTNESAQIFGGAIVNYSCIQGWTGILGGIGNISDDPMFVRNPDDGGDGWGVGGNDDYGDLRLSSGSPCIDAGENTAVPLDIYDIDGDSNTTERTPLDLDGISRFIDDPLTVDTGLPDLPDYPYIVDMGAYEYNP